MCHQTTATLQLACRHINETSPRELSWFDHRLTLAIALGVLISSMHLCLYALVLRQFDELILGSALCLLPHWEHLLALSTDYSFPLLVYDCVYVGLVRLDVLLRLALHGMLLLVDEHLLHLLG